MKATCKNTSCETVFEVPEEALGEKTKCPKCQREFTLLAPSTLDEIARYEKEQQKIKAEQQRIKTIESKLGKTSKITKLNDEQVNPNLLTKEIILYDPNYEFHCCKTEAVIDARFEDTLALPRNIIEKLGLTKEEGSGEYYYGHVTMDLLNKSVIIPQELGEPCITIPYLCEDVISCARIGSKTLECVKDNSRLPIIELAFSICITLLGLYWSLGTIVNLTTQESGSPHNFRVIPGWETGSALVGITVSIMPLLVGIAGIWLVLYGSKWCFSALKKYFSLKKQWKIYLKENL